MEYITILKHQNQPMHHASSLSGLDPRKNANRTDSSLRNLSHIYECHV
jgi:hypothetical protein